ECVCVEVEKFDRIFNRDDVVRAAGVDAIEHGGQSGRFTGTGDSCDQNQSALFVANMFDHFGQIELFQRPDLGGDHAQHQSDVAALLENVHTEAAQTGDAVGHIQLGSLFELLLLPVGHHAEGHVQHVFGGDAGLIRQRHQFAIHAHVRIVADLQVKVGSFALHRDSKQIVYMHNETLRTTSNCQGLHPQRSLGHLV